MAFLFKKNSFFSLLILIVFSCKKDKEVVNPASPNGNIKVSFSGSAQKGPFIIGTSISIYELDSSLSQTGRSFNTQIDDNAGSFNINNLSLNSPFVQLRADGFFFNEVCGSGSASQITLNCLARVENNSSVHVNLLTHLEKPRVEYLISTGLSFDSAKAITQREVLNIFSISLNGIQSSENLDISQTGEGNAALLAVSCILQGFRTESELSAILATISSDIKTDGVLNNSAIKSSLFDNALLLDTLVIRNNIVNYYSGLGINYNIPLFEKHIKHFILNCGYQQSHSVITYPSWSNYGQNILDLYTTAYPSGGKSLAGQLKKCLTLKLRIKMLSNSSPWMFTPTAQSNLTYTTYNFSTNEQFFTVVNPSLPFDLGMSINNGTYLIEYFENNMNIPSYSKTITIN